MAQNSAELLIGGTGSIMSFPAGTVVQYGAYADAPTGVKEHGLVSDAGVTISTDRSTSNIVAWQNAQVVRTVTTESSVTFQFTLFQRNADNNELVYGATPNATTGAYHWDIGKAYERRGWFFDVIDESRGSKIRYYLPSAEITAIGDQTIASAEVVAYDITLTAYLTDVEGEVANTLIWEDVYPEVVDEG